jgi:hypothetical protein
MFPTADEITLNKVQYEYFTLSGFLIIFTSDFILSSVTFDFSLSSARCHL